MHSVSAHGSTDGKFLSCDEKRCGRGLDCTCENIFKSKTPTRVVLVA